jgi:hypothetical protein
LEALWLQRRGKVEKEVEKAAKMANATSAEWLNIWE